VSKRAAIAIFDRDGRGDSRVLSRSMTTTIVYLIRHAQSQPSASTDHALWPLSRRGQEQAASLAELLEPLGIERMYCSPYTRCVQTIAPFAKRCGLEVTTIDDLREMLIVNEHVDDFRVVWRRVWEDFGYAVPGCESAVEAQHRFIEAVDGVVRESLGRTIGIGAHGMVIGLFLNSLDSSFGREETEAILNPDVIRIEAHDGRFARDASFRIEGLAEIASHPDETPYETND